MSASGPASALTLTPTPSAVLTMRRGRERHSLAGRRRHLGLPAEYVGSSSLCYWLCCYDFLGAIYISVLMC